MDKLEKNFGRKSAVLGSGINYGKSEALTAGSSAGQSLWRNRWQNVLQPLAPESSEDFEWRRGKRKDEVTHEINIHLHSDIVKCVERECEELDLDPRVFLERCIGEGIKTVILQVRAEAQSEKKGLLNLATKEDRNRIRLYREANNSIENIVRWTGLGFHVVCTIVNQIDGDKKASRGSRFSNAEAKRLREEFADFEGTVTEYGDKHQFSHCNMGKLLKHQAYEDAGGPKWECIKEGNRYRWEIVDME